jgi:hypothetical protein
MEPATHRILIVALAIGLVVGLLAPVTSGRASELENSHTGYYLVDMIEQTRASPDFLKIPIFERATGEGAQDIYEIRIPLLKGDLVYLRGPGGGHQPNPYQCHGGGLHQDNGG